MRDQDLGDLALLTPRAILLQSKAERIRAWVRTRLPACCLERDSWSAYIFPPQSRSAPLSLLLMGNSPVTLSQGC